MDLRPTDPILLSAKRMTVRDPLRNEESWSVLGAAVLGEIYPDTLSGRR